VARTGPVVRSIVPDRPGPAGTGRSSSGVAGAMFGRHRDRDAPPTPDAEVDVHLEWDIDAVRQAVATFLQSGGGGARHALVSALEELDRQIDLGDTYTEGIVDSPLFGQAPKGAIVGQTSSHSMAEVVPAAVFGAQIALVRAAKHAVVDPSPGALADLRKAALTAATDAAGQVGGVNTEVDPMIVPPAGSP
jgi:hypothetical protein